MKLTKPELSALKYAGFLGHEFIVLNDKLQIRAECPSLVSAQQSAVECNGTIYQQLQKRKWRKVGKISL